MKSRLISCWLLVLFILPLSGCGGGGGSEAPAVSRTVSGVASKGLIRNGSVNIYAVSAGVKGSLLASTYTDNNGHYSASVGSYTGPVLVEVSGAYTDEATGALRSIPASAPLRAAFDNITTSNITVAVTPLTDIAFQKAGALTAPNIKAANALVSDLFKVPDIIGTVPVDATPAALQAASTAQADYTLALAAISEMVKNRNAVDVSSVIATLTSGITGNTMSAQVAAQFLSALNAFVAANPTLLTTAPSDLLNMGKRTLVLKLGLQSTQNAGGISGVVSIPAGVTIKVADASTGRIDPSVVTVQGNATFEGRFMAATTASGGKVTFGIISTTITPGEIATLQCNAEPGVEPSQGQFQIEPSFTIVDTNGVIIAGTVSATAAFP